MSDMFLKGMIGFCFAFLLLSGVSALMERYAPERIWDKLFLPFQSRKKEEREKKEKKASRISRNAFMPEIARTSPLLAGQCSGTLRQKSFSICSGACGRGAKKIFGPGR